MTKIIKLEMKFVDRKYCRGCKYKSGLWCKFWSEDLKRTWSIKRVQNCRSPPKIKRSLKIRIYRFIHHEVLQIGVFDIFLDLKDAYEYDEPIPKITQKALGLKYVNYKEIALTHPNWFDYKDKKLQLSDKVKQQIDRTRDDDDF